MMYNYEDFDADYPKDKATLKFLLCDYFHDSEMSSIEFHRSGAKLDIHLQCERDWESSKRGAFNDEEHGYILRFYGVAGLRCCTDLPRSIYINGRFKNTAWLATRQEEEKRKLYQFRIGFVDGYIDILFHDFQIRKLVGAISYRDIEVNENPCLTRYQVSSQRLQEMREKLLSRVDPTMDDVYLIHLFANGAEDLPTLCREVLLQDRDDEAMAYAAWLLGKCGKPSDSELVRNAFASFLKDGDGQLDTNDMRVRNYLDALESLNALAEL